MATNKEIIRKVNEGFSEGNVEKILEHVAEDVRWDIVGISTHIGKEAFGREVKNENFEGLPLITVTTEIEEGDYLAVEGEVQCRLKGGAVFKAYFFDAYRLENGKIREMRSYLIEKK